MADENDIVFGQYSVDLLGIIRAILEAVGASNVTIDGVVSFVQSFWGTTVVFLLLFALISLIGYIYAAIRFNQLAEIEYNGIREMEAKYQELYGAKEQSRFADIETHVTSDNPNDWKLAIIEADIELEKALDTAGYPGATVGEKLKSARTNSNLQTIDAAWDAHLIRNKIAHQGADFVLTKKLAQQAITQYRQVFAELDHQ